VTPCVSKHRLFAWVTGDVVPDHALIAIARDDDYFFGVLQARPHTLWALRTGTQVREKQSGNRYTPTTTFETYPFPWPPGREPAGDPRVAAIADPPGASPAEEKARTLTALYNARPTWLALAHEALDRAVFAAYGWPEGLTDDEILERLLRLNGERSA